MSTEQNFISQDKIAQLTELINELNKTDLQHLDEDQVTQMANQLHLAAERLSNDKKINLESVLKTSPDVLFHLKSNGDILNIHANPGTLIRPVETFRNKNFTDLIAENNKSECLSTIKEAIKSNTPQPFNHKVLYESKYYFFEGRMVKNGNDEVVYSVRDITAKTKTQKVSQLLNEASKIGGKSNISITEFCQFIETQLKEILVISTFSIAQYAEKEGLTCLHLATAEKDRFNDYLLNQCRALTSYVRENKTPTLLHGEEIKHLLNKVNGKEVDGNVTCWMGAPLMADGNSVGVISCVSESQENIYDEEDLELLSLVGNQLGIWIEKKRIEDHEKSLSSLFENIPYEVYIFGEEDLKARFLNKKARLNLGYEEDEEIQNLSPVDIIKDYDENRCRKLLSNFKASGEKVTWFEAIHMRKDGSEYPAEIKLKYSEYKGEKVIETLILDMTERKKTEKNLKEFEHFFHSSHDLMCIADDKGYFKKINSAFIDLLGYDEETLLSTPFIDFVHPDDVARTYEEIENPSSGGNTAGFTNRYRCIHGNYKWLRWKATPDEKSGLTYATARNITKEIELINDLRGANTDLQLIDSIYNALMLNKPLDEIINLTMDSIPELLEFHSGRFYLYNEQENKLTLKNQRLKNKFVQIIEDKVGSKTEAFVPPMKEGSKFYEAIIEKKIISLQTKEDIIQAFKDHASNRLIKTFCGWLQSVLNVNGFLIIPLQTDDRIFGLIQIASEKVIPNEDIERIYRFSSVITTALAKSLAEEENMRTQNFLGDVLDNLPAEIAVFDEEHKYKLVNKAAITSRKNRDWIIGKDDFDYCKMHSISNDLAKKRRSYFDKAVKSKSEIGWIDTYGSTDNEKHVLRKFYPVFENNQLKHVLGYGMDITERIHAERQNTKLASIVSRSSDGIISIDKNSKVISWNQAATNMFGYSEEEMIGEDVSIIVPLEKILEYTEFAKKSLIQGENITTETVRKRKDGSLIDVSVSVFPLKNDNNEIIGASAITRDISYKKASEQALIDSEAKLKEAQRIAHIGSWEWKVAENEVVWSDELYKIFEVPKDGTEINFEIYMNCVFAEDRELVQNHVQETMMTKQGYLFRHRINSPSKGVKFVESRGNVEMNDKGDVIRLFGTCLDITDRVESEKAKEKFTQHLEEVVDERTRELRISQNELKYQVDSLNHVSLISITDTQGNITYVNDLFCEKSGYSREELLGKNHRILKSGLQPDSLFVDMWSTITKGHIWNGEVMDKAKNGNYFWGDTTIVPFINIDGKIEKYMAIRFDITERKSMQTQLTNSLHKQLELGELKSRFISTASHQFRTPLTVIQSNVDLLKMSLGRISEENKGLIEKVVYRNTREVKRMTKIMDELLTLEKLSAGGVTPIFSVVNVTLLCKEIVEKHNDIQEDGRIAKVEIQGNPFELELDRNLFEDAFSNILSNAFKYSKNKPAPKITLKFNNDFLSLLIEDFGMGIPDKDLKNLFTPFFRASNVLDIPGTGLGTSIMKEYIEINNGTLEIRSEVGKGTTVEINLSKIKYEEKFENLTLSN